MAKRIALFDCLNVCVQMGVWVRVRVQRQRAHRRHKAQMLVAIFVGDTLAGGWGEGI